MFVLVLDRISIIKAQEKKRKGFVLYFVTEHFLEELHLDDEFDRRHYVAFEFFIFFQDFHLNKF